MASSPSNLEQQLAENAAQRAALERQIDATNKPLVEELRDLLLSPEIESFLTEINDLSNQLYKGLAREQIGFLQNVINNARNNVVNDLARINASVGSVTTPSQTPSN